MRSLQAQLSAFHDGMLDRLPAHDAAVFRRLEKELAAADPLADPGAGAPGPGDPAPDFTLPDHAGHPVTLSEVLARGPAVLLFHRGGWCPFCTITLRAFQDTLPALRRMGASLIAVSPQKPGNCAAAAERNALCFPLLSDRGNRVAEQWGVARETPEAVQAIYRRMGHDLPAINGAADWRVPLPATFVIGTDGIVAAAEVGRLPHHRMEPSRALAAVRALTMGALHKTA